MPHIIKQENENVFKVELRRAQIWRGCRILIDKKSFLEALYVINEVPLFFGIFLLAELFCALLLFATTIPFLVGGSWIKSVANYEARQNYSQVKFITKTIHIIFKIYSNK